MGRRRKTVIDENGIDSSADEESDDVVETEDYDELERRARSLGASINDVRDEDALFRGKLSRVVHRRASLDSRLDPGSRKRQRFTGGRDDQTYGVFNDDDSDEARPTNANRGYSRTRTK